MQIEERSGEVWQWPTAESILFDWEHASRQLQQAPTFSAVVIIILALGSARMRPFLTSSDRHFFTWRLTTAMRSKRLCCKLQGERRATETLAYPRRHAVGMLSLSPMTSTASASAPAPMPKARSTMRASPRMSFVRLKIAAWPLRRARITSNPMMVA